jgi:DNA repair exonuclease SbcCD ATPase subunit
MTDIVQNQIDVDFLNNYIKKMKEHSDDFHDKLVIQETKSELFEQKLKEELQKQVNDHNKTAEINSQLNAKVNELQDKIKEHLKTISDHSKTIEKLTSENNNLTHIVNQKNQETEELQKQINTSKNDNDKVINPSPPKRGRKVLVEHANST